MKGKYIECFHTRNSQMVVINMLGANMIFAYGRLCGFEFMHEGKQRLVVVDNLSSQDKASMQPRLKKHTDALEVSEAMLQQRVCNYHRNILAGL